MSPTNIVKALLVFSLVVWLFCIGLVIGTKKVRAQRETDITQPYTVVQNTVVYTQQAQQQIQTQPTEEISTATVISEQTTAIPEETTVKQKEETTEKQEEETTEKQNEEATGEPEQTQPSEITDFAEVAKLYSDAVNNTKALTDFSLKREDTLNLYIDEATGGSLVKSFANSFVSARAPHTVDNLVFSGGVDTKGSGETPMNALPPITGNAVVDAAGLSSASAVPNEKGGYNISLAFVDDVQTLDSPAKYLSTAMEVIDVAALGLPSAINIKALSITYSGATIEATTDEQGKITSMTHHLPVSHAEGSGNAMGIAANMKLHGDFTCVYTFTY